MTWSLVPKKKKNLARRKPYTHTTTTTNNKHRSEIYSRRIRDFFEGKKSEPSGTINHNFLTISSFFIISCVSPSSFSLFSPIHRSTLFTCYNVSIHKTFKSAGGMAENSLLRRLSAFFDSSSPLSLPGLRELSNEFRQKSMKKMKANCLW